MKKSLSYLILFLATVIWGFAFVAQKAAVVLPAFTLVALRSAIASLFLILIIPLTDKLSKNNRSLINKNRLPDITRAELFGGMILGVLLSAASSLQQIGIENTDAGKTAFITALYVVFVPIIATLSGKLPSLNVIISVPISVLGFYLLCIKPGVGIESSDILLLLCAVIFAFQITAVGKFSIGCDGIRMSLIQLFTTFVINTILALIFDGIPSVEIIADVLPSLLYLGIGSSGIAYTLQIVGQKDTDPTIASIILSLEAVFGVIGASILLGERMLLREYLGCGAVFLAVLISQLDVKYLKKLFKKVNNDNKT